MIASTTVIVGVSTQIISLCLVLTTVLQLEDQVEAYWFSHILLHVALTTAALTVVRFLNFMMGTAAQASSGKSGKAAVGKLIARFSKKKVTPAESYKVADPPAAADVESKAAAGGEYTDRVAAGES
tara:strand:- start:260 stop:637 length:378 start_codon:yes stop_codon:yes gene_type:complete